MELLQRWTKWSSFLDSESFKYKTNITGNTYKVSLTIIGDGGKPVPNPDYDANKGDENKNWSCYSIKTFK